MGLGIETWIGADGKSAWRPGNNFGGTSLFKALGHPKTAPLGSALSERLARFKRLAVYDPARPPGAEHFHAFFDLTRSAIVGVFAQNIADVGHQRLGRPTRPITDLPETDPDAIFIAAFDAGPYRQQIAPLIPAGAAVLSLDDMRLPDDWLANKRDYLDPLNFATNFALLRDQGGRHTRIVTANYWAGYGAADAGLWLCLFDEAGRILAEWTETLPGAFGGIAIDSRDVRRRFGLGEFTGSLFMHALRVKGHDVVKYALDAFSGDHVQLSCTHDANAWPADLYAGVPAPKPGEKLVLWVQNSHPVPIPGGGIGVNLIGSQDIARFAAAIAPFATQAIDLGRLLPDAKWPSQIEIQAGRYMVRPRYEVTTAAGRARIAHANVERTDLKPDPKIAELGPLMGKGYIMPLPVMPLARFRTLTVPTPMATHQRELPLKIALIDANAQVVAERRLGRVARRSSVVADIDAWLAEAGAELPSGYGHVEYLYDFTDGGEADGWLHALARYEQRGSGHVAETIFGAHMYNLPLVYRDEPQSYSSRPPGLSTRLFLRLAPGLDGGLDTLCHLIYPASRPWRAHSATALVLLNGQAKEVARRDVAIPCGGSLFWRMSESFSAAERQAAGAGGYVQVRDTTCRLFGYHGLLNGEVSFSFDHMFGF